MKVAIIAYYFSESSLCLAKNLGLNSCEVDYYFIAHLKSPSKVPGFEYTGASNKPGIVRLNSDVIPEIIDYTKGLPVKIHLLRLLAFSKRLYFINKLIFKYSFKKIKEQHYDAINVIGQVPEVKDIHCYLKNENIVHTLHEVGMHDENNSILTPLLEILINSKTKVILPSVSSYNRYVALKGYQDGCAVTIPMGKFETLKLYEKDTELDLQIKEDNVFLFYGNVRPYKGLDLLAKSVKILHRLNSNFHIIIAGIGDDPSLSYFRKLQNATVINRFLNNNELVYLNKLCACVVCPYKSASQSGIVLSSFIYGKPVIANRVGAFSEYIKHGVNGLLVRPGSPYNFAKAMERIIENKKLLSDLSKGAYNFGQGDDYDWEGIAKKTILFFNKKI